MMQANGAASATCSGHTRQEVAVARSPSPGRPRLSSGGSDRASASPVQSARIRRDADPSANRQN